MFSYRGVYLRVSRMSGHTERWVTHAVRGVRRSEIIGLQTHKIPTARVLHRSSAL